MRSARGSDERQSRGKLWARLSGGLILTGFVAMAAGAVALLNPGGRLPHRWGWPLLLFALSAYFTGRAVGIFIKFRRR